MLRRTMPAAAAATVVAGAAGLAYSMWEATQYTLRRYELPLLPPGSDPLRILHFSDVHLTTDQPRKAAWISALADLDPDLVVTTGDNLAAADAVPVVLDAYEPLLQRDGVFVFGSNDYYGPTPKNPARYLLPRRQPRLHGEQLPWRDLRQGFLAAGWRDLSNLATSYTINGVTIDCAGVDDAHHDLDDYAAVAGSLHDTVDLRVGVTHAPYLRVLHAMAADGADLILAGHTHGGQLCIPGYGAIVTNCDLPTGQASGLSRIDDAWLHVSAGLGTSPYTPVRFACRPEASLITLTANPAD